MIKRIKDAESQAMQIVEDAKADTVKQAEQSRLSCNERLAQAEQARKKAIKEALEAAQAEGNAEVESLNAQAEKNRQELCGSVSSKIPAAAGKVMDYLKG